MSALPRMSPRLLLRRVGLSAPVRNGGISQPKFPRTKGTGAAQTVVVFSAIQDATDYVVPDSAPGGYMTVIAFGSGGKGGVYVANGYNWGDGGAGAVVVADVPYAPGETLKIYVGGGGTNNAAASGNGYSELCGGYSGVLRNTTPLVVAGGGGIGTVNSPTNGLPATGLVGAVASFTTRRTGGGGATPNASLQDGGSSFVDVTAINASASVGTGFTPNVPSVAAPYAEIVSPGGLTVGRGGIGPKASVSGTGAYGSGLVVLIF